MFKPDGSRRDFPLSKDRVVVGRRDTCDLRIPLSAVSRQHCELRIHGGQIVLRDMGSSNGTFRNSTRIQETMLEAGDEITVGPVVFFLQVDGLPETIEPVRSLVDQHAAAGASSTQAGERPYDPEVALQDGDGSASVTSSSAVEDEEEDPLAAIERLINDD